MKFTEKFTGPSRNISLIGIRALIILVVFALFYFPSHSQHNLSQHSVVTKKTLYIPHMENSSVHDAIDWLKKEGFSNINRQTVAVISEIVPKGKVVGTVPEANHEVDFDEQINIIISAGKATVGILLGADITTVINYLNKYNVHPIISYIAHPTHLDPPNYIIDSTIANNAIIGHIRNKRFVLTVSPGWVYMPNFIFPHSDIGRAKNALLILGYHRSIVEVDDNRFFAPHGQIIAQDPAPGTRITPDSTITISWNQH